MAISNQKKSGYPFVDPNSISSEDAKKFIGKLGEFRRTIFEKKRFNPGDFVYDQRYGEFGLIYGQFPRYSTDKGPRYAVLVVGKSEPGSSEEFSYRIRYSPQKALTALDPPESWVGGEMNVIAKESEVSHFCNNQCMFSECEDCIFERYHLKRKEEVEDDE